MERTIQTVNIKIINLKTKKRKKINITNFKFTLKGSKGKINQLNNWLKNKVPTIKVINIYLRNFKLIIFLPTSLKKSIKNWIQPLKTTLLGPKRKWIIPKALRSNNIKKPTPNIIHVIKINKLTIIIILKNKK